MFLRIILDVFVVKQSEFTPPHSLHVSLPQVSSQHPYAEQYIGRPHVITIDFNNSEEFDATIREIMRIDVRSFSNTWHHSLSLITAC